MYKSHKFSFFDIFVKKFERLFFQQETVIKCMNSLWLDCCDIRAKWIPFMGQYQYTFSIISIYESFFGSFLYREREAVQENKICGCLRSIREERDGGGGHDSVCFLKTVPSATVNYPKYPAFSLQ